MAVLFIALALTQAIGAVIGAGGSIFAEIFYFRAIRDGRIDDAERDHLRIIAHALRIGMIIILVSSIGLVLMNFAYVSEPQPALTASYWILMTLAMVVIIASWGLSRRVFSFSISTAAIFTGWWFMAFLVLGRLPDIGYGSALGLYVIATAIVALILSYTRFLIRQ